MTKKVLMLAAKANMIQQFNHRNIKILQELGYEVHVATNMVDFGSMSEAENERLKQWMIENDVIAHQIDFERRMGTVKGNIRSIKQLRHVFNENKFSFIHVHSPLGSILGRLVAKQYKVPTIYTAHGFHFFKSGPKSSWLVFYPLEWFFSFFTDTLITINEEDYELSKKRMHAKHIIKINGNGVDVSKAWAVTKEYKKQARERIFAEFKIPEDSFLISSIGELSERKNHRIVLEAIRLLLPQERKKVYYIIAGSGPKAEELSNLAKSFGFSHQFMLLGYRNDVHEVNYASDISAFPSLREGLGIAGLEAILDGTPLIATSKGGVSDYIESGITGLQFDPKDARELSNILHLMLTDQIEFINEQHEHLKKFDVKVIDDTMRRVYKQW
ncbi:glycosyltransferase [Leuconostoc lactis]|uniref:glycosyltransferase n=1 Tax=Leuconostoc lactis TaxID=1246 RepID=UPI0009FFC8A4|nr:glycosyltransferase [Leuconostoc lactis]ORI85239.1 glycosyl transferase [Leuconostoc lactis]ORI87128.1 glycosyl transferase [Leuconostoc lactis]